MDTDKVVFLSLLAFGLFLGPVSVSTLFVFRFLREKALYVKIPVFVAMYLLSLVVIMIALFATGAIPFRR